MTEKITGTHEVRKQSLLDELTTAWQESLRLNAWPKEMTGEKDFEHGSPDQAESRERYNRAVEAARQAGIPDSEIEDILKHSGKRILL